MSLRNVEDLPHDRGIEISHEMVRSWWNRFGPLFAAEIKGKRVEAMRARRHLRGYLDEIFVKINGPPLSLACRRVRRRCARRHRHQDQRSRGSP